MILAVRQHDQLPASIPTTVVFLAALAAVGLWVFAHRLRRRSGARWGALGFLARVGVGFVALTLVSQALQRVLVFATDWPLWILAIAGAFAVETVIALYAIERRTVSRRWGRLLVAARLTLILLVLALLAQPERTLELTRSSRRTVAVLVDDSPSMHVADTQLGASEKLRLAESLGVDAAARPWRLEEVRAELDALRSAAAARVDYLMSLQELGDRRRGRRLSDRREGFAQAVEDMQTRASAAAERLAGPLGSSIQLSAELRRRLTDAKSAIAVEVRDPLKRAGELLEPRDAEKLAANYGPLLSSLRGVADALVESAPRVSRLAEEADEAYYETLSPETRERIDALAGKTRAELTRLLLTRPDGEGRSLLDRLAEQYEVRMVRFGARPASVTVEDYLAADSASEATTAPTSRPVEEQSTDLAAALESLLTAGDEERLAGVLLFTEGRHNVARPLDPLVTQLAKRSVPVSSAVLGGRRPPKDAAIADLDAPETVYARDRMVVMVDLKLDALKDEKVRVTLYDGDRKADEQTLTVPAESWRTRLELADEPNSVGEHAYRVKVEEVEGEVLDGNNTASLSVRVTRDRTKVLLIDHRPRWEFRYLKNLFADRDKTVKLQYVLLEPDHVAGRLERRKIPASASRPLEQVEATALPESEEEWLKFDVVILGDVPPASLEKEDAEALHKFVTERGGTLVVIAGPSYMPHAYEETLLAEVLPVSFEPSTQAVFQAPEPQYRLAMTPAGREDVILRQKVDPAENREVWNALPPLYWRHPIKEAKPGATVLAYAVPPDAPDYVPQPRPAGADAPAPAPSEDPADAETLAKRRRFERTHALLVRQAGGLGQVLFLGFDRTWRLRYRVGDTYHHKFWGQVLRWATGGKLPAGTDFVKLGPDRSRYAPDQHVRVKAKIVDREYVPVVSDEVAVKLFDGSRLVTRAKMSFVSESPGLYTADLGTLPPGRYRIELDAPDAEEILAADEVDKVSTTFAVEAAAPEELVELAPDRGLLSRLARRSNGRSVDAPAARELIGSLAPPDRDRAQRRSYALWYHWPTLVLILAVATLEWVARKKVGLP